MAEARSLLEAGEIYGVLEAVERVGSGAQPAEAAALLVRAAKVSLEKGDRWMAGRYCAAAVERSPREQAALELCLRLAVGDERWDDASRFSDGLAATSSKDAEVALLRAHAAIGARKWSRVREILKPHLGGPRGERAGQLIAEASALQAQEKEAQDLARSRRVLYVTSWCPSCKKARAWLKAKGIACMVKDIEKDEGAAREHEAYCLRTGRERCGVPVFVAGEQVAVGFGEGAYQEMLR